MHPLSGPSRGLSYAARGLRKARPMEARDTDETPEAKKRTGRHSETRERQKRVLVRFLDDEFALLQERAQAANLSLAAYMRASAIGSAGPRAKRSPTLDHAVAARAIAELNKAGSNLNQIARALNMAFTPEARHVREAADAVRDAARGILRAFGFKTGRR